jgi:metallo-beta-lactamase family protein
MDHCSAAPVTPTSTPSTPTRFEQATGLRFTHHGAVRGVTGSCHQFHLDDGPSVLVDCGLFQGAETSPDGRAGPQNMEIGFSLDGVRALIVTHVHIDHVGRVPYLLAAGFKGPIVCSQASAVLLPMVLEDALKVGFTRDRGLIQRVLAQLRDQIVALPYGKWHDVIAPAPGAASLKMRFRQAGHILGSAFVELDATPKAAGVGTKRIVFSGDLGCPDTPLLPAPQPMGQAPDVLVVESTYGDRRHESRATRTERLRKLCEHAFDNGGTVLIPAFSIGRTQELLYELEEIIHAHRNGTAAPGVKWQDLTIVVDSPLAADFTEGYAKLRAHWDEEATQRLAAGRHPLDFKQLQTVDSHELHLKVVRHLAATRQPAVVIAASGMCSGGRIVNYLKAMLGDPRHDVLFCGYQAAGTPGRVIQREGPKGGTVELDGEHIAIRAGIHTIGGYSAHADQQNLLDFIETTDRGRASPGQVRIVHGDDEAKQTLARLVRERHPRAEVVVPVA